MTLDEARERVGATVDYHFGGAAVDRGVITEVRGDYVFVRYGTDLHAKATCPWDLTLTPDTEGTT